MLSVLAQAQSTVTPSSITLLPKGSGCFKCSAWGCDGAPLGSPPAAECLLELWLREDETTIPSRYRHKRYVRFSGAAHREQQ